MPDLALIKQAKQAGCGRLARPFPRSPPGDKAANRREFFAAGPLQNMRCVCRPLSAAVPKSRACADPVRLKLSTRRADDRLLRLRFAIIISPGNPRPYRGQGYMAVFGLLLPERT
jgi:hypothetical protein